MIETLHPENEAAWLALRRPIITSTEVAALFNCSPWVTYYELWKRKHDNLEVEFESNERVAWGQRLEAAIAQGIAEDEGLAIRRMDEFIQDTELKLGASFDYAIDPDGILEIKNVDGLVFKDKWGVDGENIEEPIHIAFQVQTQLMLSGRKYALLRPLVGGNRIMKVRREPDVKVHKAIQAKVKEFWDSVRDHKEPKPDFAQDADFISKIYSFAEPGRVLNADDRISKLAETYRTYSIAAKAAEDKKDAARAEILTLIGDAERVVGETFSISAGLIGPKWIERYERKGYRSFKVNWKKEKPNG
jgi:putative phage-type endonuclease